MGKAADAIGAKERKWLEIQFRGSPTDPQSQPNPPSSARNALSLQYLSSRTIPEAGRITRDQLTVYAPNWYEQGDSSFFGSSLLANAYTPSRPNSP